MRHIINAIEEVIKEKTSRILSLRQEEERIHFEISNEETEREKLDEELNVLRASRLSC